MPRIWSHMPNCLKSIGKSKVLVATLSDTKPERDLDSDQEDKFMVFTATVEEVKVKDVSKDQEELDESNLEKLDEQADIRKAYEKL